MTQHVALPPSTRPQDQSPHTAAVSTDENAALAADRERLARAIRELATDLARARRDCRAKQQRIDSLQAENARLLAAAPAVMRRDDPDPEVTAVSDGVHKLWARRRAHEHTLEMTSSAVLVLRHGTLALKQENASLRLELASLREQQTGSTDGIGRRGRQPRFSVDARRQ